MCREMVKIGSNCQDKEINPYANRLTGKVSELVRSVKESDTM